MIFVYGDIIVDILVYPDGDLKYGSDTTGSVRMIGGGSAANFAAWAAVLGNQVHFVGKTGNDLAGEFLSGDLQSYGIRTNLIAATGARTGTIVVFVDRNGERTMITDRGANLSFTPEDIPVDILRESRHLHVTGYSFFGAENLLETARHTIGQARSAGLTVSIDPSSWALLSDFGAPRFLELTAGCDIIFPNLEEGRILAAGDDEEEIVRRLARHYKLVVLKLGEPGCLIGTGETVRRVAPAGAAGAAPPAGVAPGTSGAALPAGAAPPAGVAPGTSGAALPAGAVPPAVDSTGAGDAFAAAFISAWLRDPDDPVAAAQAAISVAGNCVQISGGRPQVAGPLQVPVRPQVADR